MTLKEILNDLGEKDFVIRITPFIEDNVWDGDVQVTLVSSEDNPLDEEDFAYMSHLCSMLCATIPVIEEDEYVRDTLHHYVMNRLEDDPTSNNKPSYTKEGNVLTLSSKTRGTC